MKSRLVLATLLLAGVSWAGEPYTSGQEDYDQSTGLLILPVRAKIEKSGASSYERDMSKNLFIYDPATKRGRNLFDRYYGQITAYFLESHLTKDGEMHYIGSWQAQPKNNIMVRERPIRSSILIETFNSHTEEYTVWKAEKRSGAPAVMFKYARPASWHVDTKAGVIRLVSQEQEQIAVKEYVW